jgi:hypothetical protein
VERVNPQGLIRFRNIWRVCFKKQKRLIIQ